eukprot:TRINITY_DN1521_c0_g1_i4.p1 TRINITY_DN1521_c0_g1~~TRINITY_DN1521_c0_g1_i4.p1  ORF type:complete len:707 (+),score=215.07 TRINITY_DN1521_c0_g1_i4:132-2252(+)
MSSENGGSYISLAEDEVAAASSPPHAPAPVSATPARVSSPLSIQVESEPDQASQSDSPRSMSRESSVEDLKECVNRERQKSRDFTHEVRPDGVRRGKPYVKHQWEFPGWGAKTVLDKLDVDANEEEEHHEKLGEWYATSICGNDITASCLYCTGLVIADAGVWAPLCMFLVVITLYLFRKIYGEAVTALPLNGGAYNVLLNTTTKSTASLAACLTILSYVATGVVSAASAVTYFSNIWHDAPIAAGTIVLLGFFALLTLIGISESARTALLIFVIHMITLAVLLVTAAVYVARNGFHMLSHNASAVSQPVFGRALFYGFSSAMLGVTGFETSANFVEEQKEGVFVKTLRNMWAICAVFNPLLCLMCLAVVPVQQIKDQHLDDSLAYLGLLAGGNWLRIWVSIDAFLVLAGSVLTSYVGVTGLCRRLAMDRCLPQFLLAENEWRRTNHYIIVGFFALCTSLYVILRGDVSVLSNVYTVSFLGVMGLFAFGDMLLKYKRNDLPRSVKAPWPTVVIGFLLVVTAFAGTIAKDSGILVVWLIYFVGTGLIVSSMFFRIQVLKFIHYFGTKILRKFGFEETNCLHAIAATIKSINSQSIAFFTKSANLSVLNKAILYVRQNEDCSCIRIVHCYEQESDIPANFHEHVALIDEIYPKIKIDLVLVKGKFCPALVSRLSQELDIPRNLMFIACPTAGFTWKVSALGGVRLITH